MYMLNFIIIKFGYDALSLVERECSIRVQSVDLS